MTIVEIEDTLPNGLHDAVIDNIFVDFINKEAKFGLRVSVGDPDSPTEEGRDAYRRGILTITNLFFFITMPEDNFLTSPNYSMRSLYPIEPEELPVKIANRIPDTVFINVIYTDRSAIYIAAENAEFEWTE